ncbi:hypothetical protein II906_00320 [bacterium]|nr:hypothetical protein [bacterium]
MGKKLFIGSELRPIQSKLRNEKKSENINMIGLNGGDIFKQKPSINPSDVKLNVSEVGDIFGGEDTKPSFDPSVVKLNVSEVGDLFGGEDTKPSFDPSVVKLNVSEVGDLFGGGDDKPSFDPSNIKLNIHEGFQMPDLPSIDKKSEKVNIEISKFPDFNLPKIDKKSEKINAEISKLPDFNLPKSGKKGTIDKLIEFIKNLKNSGTTDKLDYLKCDQTSASDRLF